MVVVQGGYGSLVMSAEDAFRLAEIIGRAERFHEKWKPTTDGGPTYHVYVNEDKVNMLVISDDLYRLAKLAGKPEEK